MNIMHFCPSRSFSGLEQYALELALNQKGQGHHVCFVSAPNSTLERKCTENQIATLSFDNQAPGEMFRFLPILKKELARKYDVIHLHSTTDVARFFFFRNAISFSKLHWPKTILQIHLWINHRKKDPFHWLLYSALDEVWCSSNPARHHLLKLLPVEPGKIKIINYGRDVIKLERNFSNRDEVRRSWHIPFDAIVYGTVNRFEKSKGLEEFFEAGVTLLHLYPQLHLVFIGGPSPENLDAQTYFRNLMVRHSQLSTENRARIHMLGPVAESYKYLKAFDVYVLPSYEECFSLSLLDAQLAGLPVLGTQSGGTPEVVHADTGWLFEPKSVGSLKTAMENSLHSQSSWKEKGAIALARVKKDFNQSDIFKEVIKLYAE